MTMKLRIPILFAMMSLTSAVYESVPELFLSTENYILYSFQYILTIFLLFYLLEKLKVNEREVHISMGTIIIALTVGFELFRWRI